MSEGEAKSFIVAGIDGSASAQKALVAAVEQARMTQAEVRVVNVVVLPAMSGYEFGPIDLESIKQSAEKTVASAIDALDTNCGGSVPVPISSRVVTGHPGNEIMRVANEDGGASMVVVGSRGYGGVKSLLLGSVTTYLTHHLTHRLLIIPSVDEG